jgi:hypothetical protein
MNCFRFLFSRPGRSVYNTSTVFPFISKMHKAELLLLNVKKLMSRVHLGTKFSRFFLLWPAHEFYSSSATA